MTENEELLSRMGAPLCKCGKVVMKLDRCVVCYIVMLEKDLENVIFENQKLRAQLHYLEEEKRKEREQKETWTMTTTNSSKLY